MSRENEQRELRPFSDLSDTGMLWLINRVVFHPRGFALAIQRDDDGTASGWTMQGMGDEVWTFTNEADDECFAKAMSFLASLAPDPHAKQVGWKSGELLTSGLRFPDSEPVFTCTRCEQGTQVVARAASTPEPT